MSFLLLSMLMPLNAAAEPFELKDGDRVVFIGSTLIEREQRYGYWETALTARYPERNITFRNLGWSGDTVWGEARAGFDTPAVGYKRLVEHTLALKPTVIFLGYGTNESFAGKEGLERFQKQLEKLLDDLAPSKARILLLAPPLVETARWPGARPDERNHEINLYAKAIRLVAERRGVYFIGNWWSEFPPEHPSTDNGVHLSPYGYRYTAHLLLHHMKIFEEVKYRAIDLTLQKPERVRQTFLPEPPAVYERGGVDFGSDSDCAVRGVNLKPGRYTLKVNGRAVRTEDADQWLRPGPGSGVGINRGPSLDQAEKLRQTIVEKNQLFFHRYRPQNETYLFGFRKHEQGQNAKEVAQFDPLIEKLEKEIARLRVPVEHTYELVPAGEEKK